MVQFLVLSGYFQQARSHKKKNRKYHSRRLQLPSKKQKKPCRQSKNRIVGLKMCHLPLRLGQQRESPRQMNYLRNQKKAKKATDTKNPLNSKTNDVDGNEQSPENEDAGIIEEFDYHDSNRMQKITRSILKKFVNC